MADNQFLTPEEESDETQNVAVEGGDLAEPTDASSSYDVIAGPSQGQVPPTEDFEEDEAGTTEGRMIVVAPNEALAEEMGMTIDELQSPPESTDEQQEATDEGETLDEGEQDEIVQVEFIDDGDDFEMDAALAGLSGESPYPNIVRQEAWRPEFTIQDLMLMEPAVMIVTNRDPERYAPYKRERQQLHYQNALADISEARQAYQLKGRSVGGVFRRVINALTGRHMGPGDHPSGSPQTAHAGDRGGAEPAERPKHVGASLRLSKLATPRLTFDVNKPDLDEWEAIQDEVRARQWGRDPVTGDMVEADANKIASGVIEGAIKELESEGEWVTLDDGEGEQVRYEINQADIDSAVRDLIWSDIENEQYDAERQIGEYVDRIEREGWGNASWPDLADAAGLDPDEMLHMSDEEVLAAAQRSLVESVVDELIGTQSIPEMNNWVAEYIVGPGVSETKRDRIVDDLLSRLDDGVTLRDALYGRASQGILNFNQSENPMGYDADYIRDEVIGDDDEFYEQFGREVERQPQTEFVPSDAPGFGGKTLYFMGRANNGEVASVMSASPTTLHLGSFERQQVADRFGIDVSEIGDEFLYIDYLASKYPRQGYGTETILQALKYADENDMGITGNATMAASMFYAKLGAQYLSEMGQDEGGKAFWTNAQVHEAYNWLQSEMERVQTGEVSLEEVKESELAEPKPVVQEAEPIESVEQVEMVGASGALRRRHHGPGDHPSGSPQSVHAGKGKGGGSKTTQVGITSAKPGKPSRQVFEEMAGFEEKLTSISTVKNAKVEPGLGGWEGGSEPTWVVSYDGNGQAMMLIAQTAQEFDQDAVLLMKQGDNSIITDFAFQRRIKPSERKAAEDMLVESNMGGWTWYREPGGHAVLRAVPVPQWGGDPQSHLENAKKIQTMLQAAGMNSEFSTSPIEVDIMQKEGENSYEEILSQAG